MTFAFDLISDLHIETWSNFDWAGQATSPYCVVAGDVSRDHEILRETLEHLGQCYSAVFYIDGNDEHRYTLENLGDSYKLLSQNLKNIPNVVYMQDNVVIVNGVAFLATNGWWTFDFDRNLDYGQCQQWFCDRYNVIPGTADAITGVAYNDVAYMTNSVRKLQYHQDVHAIVCVTHTVPESLLVNHDYELIDTWRFNTTGNRYMGQALMEDSESKIKAWCFGHYHRHVDRYYEGIRYVNNCRGRGDTEWKQDPYYPKRIEIDF